MTLLVGVRTSSPKPLSWLVCLVPLQATRFVYLIYCQTRLVLAEEEIQLVDFTQLFTGSVAVNCSLFHALLCPLHGPRPCDRHIQQTSFTSGFSCFPFHQAGLKKSKPIGSLLLLMMFYCDVNIDRLPPPPLLFSFWAALLILLCSVLIFTLDQLIYNFSPPPPPHTHTYPVWFESFWTQFRQFRDGFSTGGLEFDSRSGRIVLYRLCRCRHSVSLRIDSQNSLAAVADDECQQTRKSFFFVVLTIVRFSRNQFDHPRF